MAQESGLSSAFPPPPEAYKFFTRENIEAYRRDPSSVSKAVADALTPADLPTKPYQIYGQVWPLEESLPTLKESGITQLYPDDFDRVKELKKLARSLLLNFLELVTIMGSAPEKFGPKVEHFRIILLNMHHLINEFRPHQGRETMIQMMKEQLANRVKETAELEQSNREAREFLARFKSLDTSGISGNIHVNSDQQMTEVEDTIKPKSCDLLLFEALKNI